MSILAPPRTESTSHDAGRGRRRTITAGWAIVAVAVLASAAYIDFAPTTLLDGVDSTVGLIERMLPPVATEFWNGVTGFTLATDATVRQVYTGNGQTYALYVLIYFLALYAASLGPAGFWITG